ncbi:MAG: thioredoxin family protein [Bdellovibrionales bacterium]|nr:thioredoxin family protein [Bdellovibrionales bacterium]
MKHLIFFFALFLFPALTLSGQVNKNPLKAVLVENPVVLPPGANKEVKLDIEIAKDHHAYLDQFRLKLKEPTKSLIGGFKINPIMEWKDVHSKKVKKGVAGKATLSFVLEAPQSSQESVEETLLLTYQACTVKYCLLPKTVEIPLKILLSTSSLQADHSPSNELMPGPSLLQQAESLGWLNVFALVFLAGILTSFTPCIFPMIPITLAILGNQNNKKQLSKGEGLRISLVYVSGIAVTYSLLGLVAASTGALFGSLLGHPAAILFISLVFFFMGLSMFGLFELQAPAFIRNKLQTGRGDKGYITTFLTGLFAGLVASPCVGPVLVSILTFVAQTQNLALGFLLLLTFAFGLGLIFIVLGTFSGLTKKIPRSGAWLNFSKYVFGSIMIGVSAYFASPILERAFVKQNQEKVSKLNWQEYSDQILEESQKNGKPVIIDFRADWCAACIELEEKTFSHPEVRDLSKDFVLLKFDRTLESDKFNELQKKYGIVGLPFVAFHSSKGTFLKNNTLTGFEDYSSFAKRMKTALSSKD